MMYLYTLLAALVVIVAIFVAPLRHKVWVATATIAVTAAAALTFAVKAFNEGMVTIATFSTSMFGEESFAVDKLSSLFLVIISIAAMATVLYSRGYVAGYMKRFSSSHFSLHYTALVLLVVSMMLVIMSSGGFSFLFSWELMTIASFILILFEADRLVVRRAALNYLVMMHIGFMFLVVGFVLLYNVTGSANFSAVEQYFKVATPLPLFVILFIGFGMKAGLFPMHIWLPEAHPAAPSHVSAIMSGVMIKTGVYGIMRLMQAVDHNTELLYDIGLIVLLSGIVTGLWGVILAAMQNDVKRLLAYSSIENIGVILIGLGIAAVGHAAGVFYGYETAGVFASDAEASTAGKYGYLRYPTGLAEDPYRAFRAGDMHFVDQNGDGWINDADMVVIGDPNPDIFGNFYTSLSWKSLTLDLNFKYSLGNDVFNYQRSQLEAANNIYNQTTAVVNRWKYDGQVTEIPRAMSPENEMWVNNERFSDRWIEDGSYLKLKKVRLTYEIPVNLSWLLGLSVWGEANNVFTVTKYLGNDPEVSCGNSVLYQGIDAGYLPTTRNFNIGVTINL